MCHGAFPEFPSLCSSRQDWTPRHSHALWKVEEEQRRPSCAEMERDGWMQKNGVEGQGSSPKCVSSSRQWPYPPPASFVANSQWQSSEGATAFHGPLHPPPLWSHLQSWTCPAPQLPCKLPPWHLPPWGGLLIAPPPLHFSGFSWISMSLAPFHNCVKL